MNRASTTVVGGGIAEVDDILFGNLDANTLRPVKVGVYQDKLYENNGFINDLISDTQVLYPSKGGAGAWINCLQKKLTAVALYSGHDLQVNGFPVLTKGFVENSAKQNALAESSCTNIKIFGRGNGRTRFMNNIISDVYQTLREPSW